MLDLPRGPELLDTARRGLLEEILPALPPEQAYTARMIAKAMAIAARELELGAGAARDGARSIAEFLGEEGATRIGAATSPAGAETAAGDRADRAQALLAECIRKRAIAPEREGQLRALLLQLTRAKLAVSNPKYLSRERA